MKTKELVLHDGVDDGRGGRVCRLRFHDDIVGMVANAKARKLLHNVITFKNNYNCSFFYISSKFAQADFDAANDVGKINIINASALFNIAALPRDDEDLVLAAKNASGNYALKVVEIPLDFEYNILSSLDGEIVSEKHRIFK